MKFVRQESTIPGLKHIDWGMYYFGAEPVRVILGPCMSILCSSLGRKMIGVSHIYPTPFDNNKFGPFNHPENVVAAYLRQGQRLQMDDLNFWIIDREKTTQRGKELIMRAIDAIVQTGYTPTILNGFPQRCALTSNPELMQIGVYDIASHEDQLV
jgi:hypothetical protein